ncbi:UDP-glycosyltransferase 92A1 [Senna tora]|uniref:Glycosyltransferase n=1 Tax=Senna tora TaxID=362788 RepID=A0A835CBW0_9FABA|nr:UDP-glycosyltransferase 92A1 [Senna tora]
METEKCHIVMVPFMAHGHLIPFLALARQILQNSSFSITIANTPLNIHYLQSAISSSPSPNLHLAPLPFHPTIHGLPPNTENAEKVPPPLLADLGLASLTLQPHLRALISTITQQEARPPLCIIYDVFFGWVSDVAKSFGTKSICFTTCGAYGTIAYMSIWLNLPHRKTDSDEFYVPGFPQHYRFHRTQLHRFLRRADGTDAWSRFFQPQIALSMNSDAWICNTVEEIEPLGLQLLRKFIDSPVYCIGPLLPTDSGMNSKHRSGKESGIPLEDCLQWLNLNPKSSVLYISFGSQNSISETQMMALAEGLEESKKPFIWVIRPPLGFDINGDFKAEWLPLGFEDRIRESKRGLVIPKWGPQLEILSHESIGAFLSHCGWNSVLESLSNGVPIIGWPLGAEQAYNSKMLEEEMGVGVELTRTVESVVTREKVKKVIEMVMEEEGRGKEMRKKAKEIAEMMRKAKREEEEEKGSSVRAMHDFVTTILS